jgi:hypothetical protein
MGILGDCVYCAEVAAIWSDPHATPAMKATAKDIDQMHGGTIDRLRRGTSANEREGALFFKGKGGTSIHCEQDEIGMFNSYVPWHENDRCVHIATRPLLYTSTRVLNCVCVLRISVDV